MEEDIIIIGAGPAGLMAAYELAKSGRKALILEARDRIGGRIHTEYGSQGLRERGAEFVHGKLPLTLALLDEAGLSPTPAGGQWIEVKGGTSTVVSDGGDWRLLMQTLKGLKEDMTLQDFLERHFADAKYAALKDQAISYAEGYDSADASRVSAKALGEEWSKEQETQYRVDKGYAALTGFLAAQSVAAGSRILCSHGVSSILAENDYLAVIAGGETFRAKKAVVALPLGVLQQGSAVQFLPANAAYASAIQQLGFGSVIKFLLRFRTPFWETKYPGLGFLLSGATVPTWWTQAPATSNLFTGWMAGRPAHAASRLSEAQLLDLAFQSLAGIFSVDREALERNLDNADIVNWTSDPLTRGAYAYETLESGEARRILTSPLQERIWFAGEYMYDGPAMGTVEAALSSGREVARQLLNL